MRPITEDDVFRILLKGVLDGLFEIKDRDKLEFKITDLGKEMIARLSNGK